MISEHTTVKILCNLLLVSSCAGFLPHHHTQIHKLSHRFAASDSEDPIVSPFEESSKAESPVATAPGDYLELTWDNVETVLDEMRPYLIQDGGNVVITEIDGPVVKLELQVRALLF